MRNIIKSVKSYLGLLFGFKKGITQIYKRKLYVRVMPFTNN